MLLMGLKPVFSQATKIYVVCRALELQSNVSYLDLDNSKIIQTKKWGNETAMHISTLLKVTRGITRSLKNFQDGQLCNNS